MTRINYGIPAAALTDQHLLAEYRELPRIFTLAVNSYYKLSTEKFYAQIPKEFTLGTGHVRFFYDKLAYLKARHSEITHELRDRQFKLDVHILVSIYTTYQSIPKILKQEHEPTLKGMLEIEDRIWSRLIEYRGEINYYRKKESFTVSIYRIKQALAGKYYDTIIAHH